MSSVSNFRSFLLCALHCSSSLLYKTGGFKDLQQKNTVLTENLDLNESSRNLSKEIQKADATVPSFKFESHQETLAISIS